MPHSHHSHSGQFCRHAKDSLTAVVAEAARRGFRVFGLSEHAPRYREADLFPEEADLTPQDLADAYTSFLAAAEAQRAAHPALSLLIGIECDAITPLDSAGLARLLADARIDYVVGSVHHVRGVSVDFDRGTWLRAVRAARRGVDETTMVRVDGKLVLAPRDADAALADGYVPAPEEMEAFLAAYFDAQMGVLQAHQPEVVGHFDLCLLWVPEASLDAVWDRVERNVRYAVGYGALFEANAAALRKGWKTSYPSPRVLQLIMSLGGRICLSDDSHGVAAVGLNYLPMREYLVQQGVKTVWHLVRAAEAQEGDEKVGMRGRVVARPVTGWEHDEFWETFKATM
ncbi:putative histidinol-phosphatase [Cutaneotrichosporon oleaginosum]|uniref:Histidinol-phosphatase n=1 Tax=Cutaneotrichosporon oleaginosum TaxID=879819 RepID=A0A0J1B2Y0_9TREE|nr:putative histidinol-phosphatase [Cutaneotrichosporon oleaginosum]KLT41959.1 putative histidinol-phosphatase [Cutaneotrichosporon oleaginosum]TXT14380.1 hypothetical protein COLE_00573 [Cutaneotrichosporon oleaginosum]